MASLNFDAVHRECSTALRAFLAARAGRNDCDDLLQDVWARALARWETFDGQNAKAWLFKIAHNCLIDRHRRRSAQPLAQLHHRIDERLDTAEVIALERERHERLQSCLGKLADEFRIVAVARLAGEDSAELARRLGLNPATVYTRWYRAKELLQTCVNGASS